MLQPMAGGMINNRRQKSQQPDYLRCAERAPRPKKIEQGCSRYILLHKKTAVREGLQRIDLSQHRVGCFVQLADGLPEGGKGRCVRKKFRTQNENAYPAVMEE